VAAGVGAVSAVGAAADAVAPGCANARDDRLHQAFPRKG
jgi:hypothetical protein